MQKNGVFYGHPIPVSFGVAAAAPFNGLNTATKKEALYQAKRNGRNRVVLYKED